MGSYLKMAAYAQEVGAECVQIFAKSPRQWHAKPLELSARDEVLNARAEYGLGPILTHTAYLINITTSNDELWAKSVQALADEIIRGSILQAEGVNTHLGNVPNEDWEAAVLRAARAIEEVYAIAEEAGQANTRLILENTAGAGTTFGGSIEQLAAIMSEADVPDEFLGICIDTCHAWAYGYDVSSAEGWSVIVDEVSRLIGLDRWMFVHANDCKFGRGEKKDRHEWIGKGHIGLDGFEALLHLEGLDHLKLLTEMPGEMPEKDVVNISVLKGLRGD